MTTTTDTPAAAELRGLPLLDAVIQQIEQHPETWDQAIWRCGTAMCVAGHAAEMTGAEWESDDSELLVAVPEDGADASSWRGRRLIEPSRRAQRLLEISDDMAGRLFSPFNDLAAIRRIRDEIAQAQS